MVGGNSIGLRNVVTPQQNEYTLRQQDAENHYQLIGQEKSSSGSTTNMRAEMDDDYADPDLEDEWNQEENVYHVLEGPAMMDEKEEEESAMPGNGQESEAMVYEIPIPLRQ